MSIQETEKQLDGVGTETPTVTAIDKLAAAINQALEEAPTSEVLSLLTGAFVGLVVELVRREGHDGDEKISIERGQQRDITIHAQKVPA